MRIPISGIGKHGMDLSGPGQGKWWALVNAIMNFRFPKNAGNFLTS